MNPFFPPCPWKSFTQIICSLIFLSHIFWHWAYNFLWFSCTHIFIKISFYVFSLTNLPIISKLLQNLQSRGRRFPLSLQYKKGQGWPCGPVSKHRMEEARSCQGSSLGPGALKNMPGVCIHTQEPDRMENWRKGDGGFTRPWRTCFSALSSPSLLSHVRMCPLALKKKINEQRYSYLGAEVPRTKWWSCSGTSKSWWKNGIWVVYFDAAILKFMHEFFHSMHFPRTSWRHKPSHPICVTICCFLQIFI